MAAGALAALGARIGIPARIERLYAATATLAAAGWMAAATALGPSAWPLSQAMAMGGLALSVPWWANRRADAPGSASSASSKHGPTSPGLSV
jgi:hypothetical protein